MTYVKIIPLHAKATTVCTDRKKKKNTYETVSIISGTGAAICAAVVVGQCNDK
jgi:hypothetical protein